eukprot:1156602-Alexandrium_andersonii.AAC.1
MQIVDKKSLTAARSACDRDACDRDRATKVTCKGSRRLAWLAARLVCAARVSEPAKAEQRLIVEKPSQAKSLRQALINIEASKAFVRFRADET